MPDDDVPVTGRHPRFAGKADFSTIYDQPDPRAYYRALRPLDYCIPQQALPVLDRVVEASARDGVPRTALDVCCSYGINGALLRTDVTLDELGRRYVALGDDVTPDEVAAGDRALLAGRAHSKPRTVYGLDAAPNAVAYATRAGLVDDAWAADLESGPVPSALAAGLRDVSLIVCTGGVGYVGVPTFEKLAGLVGEPSDLWLAVFVLRVFDYNDIAAALAAGGLVTERVEGRTFRQRRFADPGE
ncbi:hypothetical protein, partial [Jatrophihabitans endophyticus]|uniref:hypothetical protein n=1 Tax=Jatrophihabitans endophyticus TaxID=1206085 RepID=UPI001A09C7C2